MESFLGQRVYFQKRGRVRQTSKQYSGHKRRQKARTDAPKRTCDRSPEIRGRQQRPQCPQGLERPHQHNGIVYQDGSDLPEFQPQADDKRFFQLTHAGNRKYRPEAVRPQKTDPVHTAPPDNRKDGSSYHPRQCRQCCSTEWPSPQSGLSQ